MLENWILHLVARVAGFKEELLRLLGPVDIAILRDVAGLELNDGQKAVYMNPVREVPSGDYLLEVVDNGRTRISLVGGDATEIVEQIKNPRGWYRTNKTSRTFTLWMFVWNVGPVEVRDHKMTFDVFRKVMASASVSRTGLAFAVGPREGGRVGLIVQRAKNAVQAWVPTQAVVSPTRLSRVVDLTDDDAVAAFGNLRAVRTIGAVTTVGTDVNLLKTIYDWTTATTTTAKFFDVSRDTVVDLDSEETEIRGGFLSDQVDGVDEADNRQYVLGRVCATGTASQDRPTGILMTMSVTTPTAGSHETNSTSVRVLVKL